MLFPPTHPATWTEARVVESDHRGRFAWLALEAPAVAAQAAPGQFVMLDTRGSGLTLLPRAMSIMDVVVDDTGPWAIELLIEDVGPGTAYLTQLQRGDPIPVVGPLGQAWTTPPVGITDLLLVGGGVGLAPLPFFARRAPRGTRVSVLAGVRTPRDFPLGSPFEERGGAWGLLALRLHAMAEEFHVIAESGEDLPRTGTVLALLEDKLRECKVRGRHPTIVTCGPWGMMQAVAAAAQRWNVPCLALLEEHMACGTGICRVCVCKLFPDTTRRSASVNMPLCTAGPLLDAARVDWAASRSVGVSGGGGHG